MLYVGLDVHSKQSSLCILNTGGGIVKQIQLKEPRSAVVDYLRRLRDDRCAGRKSDIASMSEVSPAL